MLRLFFLPCLLLFVTFSLSSSAVDEDEGYRLPKNIVPSHYVVELTIDPKVSNFSGFVGITIVGTNVPNNTLELHASPDYITMKKYALLDYSVACNLTNTNETTEIATFVCPQGSLEGKHTFEIQYTGQFSNEDTSGIFRTTYSENKTEEVLIATHFEPVYARRAFPCFDEPSLKTTFDISITRPDVYKALGNTPEEESFYVGFGELQTKFITTPSMSTYLVGFVISNFDATFDSVNGNYTYKVYTRSSVKDKLSIANKYGSTLVELLSKWTDIPYGSLGDQQIDQVIIPDVEATTIENWGLVVYRETDLLDEGKKTSEKAKRRILMTMAHQLTDQWFNGYVTPDWWSDTWLSEGFATYFQYYIPDLIKDENLNLDHQFVVDVLQDMLQNDGLFSTPLSSNESDINSSDDDRNKFDDITFNKGASIVRMMMGMAGESNFQKAIQVYLKKYRYNNTNVEELLQEIMKAAPGRFSTDFAIKTWIYQPGYPLLYAEYNQNRSSVIISQEAFSTNSSINSTREWYIPISYTTSDEKDFSITMKDILVPGHRNEINDISNTSWFILNLQHHGYYRVHYDNWLWDKIVTALNDDNERKDIHVLNRAQLLDDIFNLAFVGRVDFEKAFDLADYLSLETDYYPWISGLKMLTILRDKLSSDRTVELLENTIRQWWVNAMTKAKNESSDTHDIIKEAFFLETSCRLGLDEYLSYTSQAFADFKKTGNIPDYNQRATIFCYGLRNSSRPVEDFNFLWKLYESSTSADERNDLLTGMGCSSNDIALSIYLGETISNGSALRPEDAPAAYRSIYMSGDFGLMTVLKFTFENAPSIYAKYEGKRVLTKLLQGVTPKLRTPEQMEKIYSVVDYYSEIDDILIYGRQMGNIIKETKEFNATYGDTIHNILTARLPPNGARLIEPNLFVTTILGLVVFYFYH